jgi:hypothetical protein
MPLPSSSRIGVGLFVLVVGAVSCGGITPLGPDGGKGGGGGSSTGTAGSHGTAGSGASGSGAAGSTGAAGTGTAGTTAVGGASGGGAAGSNPDAGAGGSGHVDAGVDHGADRPPSCPATYTTVAEGSLCPVDVGTRCDYEKGRCGCLPCSTPNGGAGTGTIWSCRAWDSGGAGCPSSSPPIGSACTTPGQFCTYGGICGISVGDNVECTAGKWQKMISPLGSCALQVCPTVNADGGTDHPPDKCSQASDCPGGVCWQGLDGSKSCITPTATPTLMSCQNAPTPCCTKNGDCTDSPNGRCLPLWNVKENYCGGAIPQGNVCRYDQCKADVDCKASATGGLPVSACIPSGAFGLFTNTCVRGVCRVDADCALHPGGRCVYGLAPTNGTCSLLDVLSCAYANDPCGDGKACPADAAGPLCVPKPNLQGRECGLPPPQFP